MDTAHRSEFEQSKFVITGAIREKIEAACDELVLDPLDLARALDDRDIADIASGTLSAEGLRLVAQHFELHVTDKEKL